MAPSPEYDKEPKGPDKTSAGGDSSVQRRTPRLLSTATNASTASPQENNDHDTQDDGQLGALYDDVTPNKTPKDREAKTSLKDNDVEALDDGQLRALLDEAIQYKCPKDREGKSNLFKELLEEVEQDEQACEAANVRGWAAGGSGRSRRRGRRVLPHSNSLQDLVDALAEPALRRRAPPVSSRTHHGGSLPSGVDTSFLLGEEPVRGTEYVATVRCVNPSPLAERRVSASDAQNGTELVNITRRSKMPVFPVTYTARATLEIGSGSVCTGRAVTTTTASNQVRTRTLSRTRNTLSHASPRDSQTLLMSALRPREPDGGGPRGPPATSTYKHRDAKGPRPLRDSLESPPVFMPPEVRRNVASHDTRKKFQPTSNNWVPNKQFRTNTTRSPISTARSSKPYSNKRFNENIHSANDKCTKSMEVHNYNVYNERALLNYSSSIGRGIPTSGPPEYRQKQSAYNYNVQRHKSLQQDLNVFVENRKYATEKNIVDYNRGVNEINFEPKNRDMSSRDNIWLKGEKRQKAGFVVKTKHIRNYRDSDDEVPFVQCSLAHHVKQSSLKNCIDRLEKNNVSVETNSEPCGNLKNVSDKNRDKFSYDAVLRKKYPLYMAETSLDTISPTVITGCDTPCKHSDDTSVNNFSNILECDNTFLGGLTCFKDDKKYSDENSHELIKPLIKKCHSPNEMLDSEVNNNLKSDYIQNENFEYKITHADLNENNDKIPVNITGEEEDCETNHINEHENNTRQITLDREVEVSEDNNNELIKYDDTELNIEAEIKMSEDKNNIKDSDENIVEEVSKENKKEIFFEPEVDAYIAYGDTEVDIDIEIKKSEEKNKIKLDNNKEGTKGNSNQQIIIDREVEINIDNEVKYYENENKIQLSKENIIEEGYKNIPGNQALTEDNRESNNANLVNRVAQDFTLSSGDQLIFAELTDTAYVFLKMPKSLFVLPENVTINNNNDTQSLSLLPSNTNNYNTITFSDIIDEFGDNVIKYQKKEGCDNEQQNMLINNNKSKQILRRVSKKSANTNSNKEVDSNVPFSCITTPEVVSSCNTTNSTSQSAIVVDPKPLQLESSYAAVSSLTGSTPSALHRLTSALQPQNSESSGFSGMPLTRYGAAGATVLDDKFQKSLDENGNTMQSYSAPLSGSSQLKKNRKKKSSKNETVIKIDQIVGYQGDKGVEELLRFIESDAETARGKLARKHDDKKRSTERHARDKEAKLPRATSMEELRRGNEHRKTERRSWGDRSDRYLEPEPHSDLELLDFQTVTKKKRPRRPPAEPPRRAPAAPDRRRKSAPPSDNNDSNDDLDSVHSLPEPAAAPRTAVSYADIARASHAIPDLIESCNFYTPASDIAAGGAVGPQKPPVADSYPTLETKTPPKKSKESTRPSPPTKKVDRPALPARPTPAPPDVVSDRRPPVILLDEARRPRDMDGVTFGFDINEQLLGGAGCDLVRGGCVVRAGEGAALTYLPPADTHRALQEQLRHIVDYVGSAWDDIVRCGNGKVRYFSE